MPISRFLLILQMRKRGCSPENDGAGSGQPARIDASFIMQKRGRADAKAEDAPLFLHKSEKNVQW